MGDNINKHYKNNKGMYEERLKPTPKEFLKFEIPYQERLKIEVRKPSTLKIDKYIEKLKEIKYEYDFGDGWKFVVKLEDIVDDYYFGFPTLLEGAETYPKHEETKAWSESLSFKKYDSK